MNRTAIADKILVLGIDGMDPVLTKQHMAEGIMPNLEKFLERGSAREDLVLLGSHPTITPPMWTTLACGCHPYVHGITDFWRQNPVKLDTYGYGLDSTLCHAEQIWNVFAEAGKKTLVWHWPGSSWPPTSESENLTVVDGTQPEGINQGTGEVWSEFIALGSSEATGVTFKLAAGEGAQMCVIKDLEEKEQGSDAHEYMHFFATAPDIKIVNTPKDTITHPAYSGHANGMLFDVSISPIKEAKNWTDAPADAKEATILFSRGLVRRPVLILKNEAGEYDRIAVYKSKKDAEPLVMLENDVFTQDIVDVAIKKDKRYEVSRNMRIVEMSPDGNSFSIWCSAETDIHDNKVWSPQSLHQEICENVGYPLPVSNLGDSDKKLIVDCMQENWMRTMKWQADCLHYMIEKKGQEIIFSHIHNDDAQKHMFIQCARENASQAKLPREDYREFLRNISRQNDYYIGRFLHLLDEGWTVLLVSDHGLTCNMRDEASDLHGAGVDGNLFVKWGFTSLKKSADGKYLPEVDWENTKAIKTRMNEIYINLKGKYPTGIVEPEDKWQLEEEIITKLYELKSPETGMRMVSLALRSKDAVHFGLGGPECGDIVFFTTDGYNQDHGDGLSTTIGTTHTSQSPIFAAAGVGIKKGFYTDRVIREIDVAPTVATLGGVRMPAQCEGAPVYQIFEDQV